MRLKIKSLITRYRFAKKLKKEYPKLSKETRNFLIRMSTFSLSLSSSGKHFSLSPDHYNFKIGSLITEGSEFTEGMVNELAANGIGRRTNETEYFVNYGQFDWFNNLAQHWTDNVTSYESIMLIIAFSTLILTFLAVILEVMN